ncbi:DUF4422 domain-containing protein [Gluconobacter kondonii]|uniref:DUF4422 domain-containing protein n=1 Tax=Gluconobacter kondonii TaxID=941463 RepID=UPI001B8C68E1|nr:DUF4422 domain-containing protein [Gluconobacter kondonii]MBS1066942.1 DUF4422 domain-containing protein [Gluconobacter kondonii]
MDKVFEKKKSTIYVCYHSLTHQVEDTVFKPIQVGSDQARFDLFETKDNTGDNISSKNDQYCEMTAVYWAWKNDKQSEWIGLMHYRRFLDFTQRDMKPDKFGCISVPQLTPKTLNFFGITDEGFYKCLEENPDCDGFFPKKWSPRDIGYQTVKDHYALSADHFEKDLSIIRSIIQGFSPEYLDAFDRYMSSDIGYFTNIFVLKREPFNKYCEWVFPILEKFSTQVDISNYSKQAKRVHGYLAERLINVFFLSEQNKNYKFVELDRVFFENVTNKHIQAFPMPPQMPEKETISIVIAADNNYVPHMAALIESIKYNCDKERKIEFLIFDGGITEHNKFLLRKQFHNEYKITFLDCSLLYKNIATHMHFSRATFYRLSIGEILKNHKKVIYIDCDTIVMDDISKLWDTDLEGKAIAAVPDLIMKVFVNEGTPSMWEAGRGMPSGIYLREYVGMHEKYDEYFQAGLIIFDLVKIREMHLSELSISEIKQKTYWFLDQDVLNKFLRGNVKFIDTAWNFPNTIMDGNCKNLDSGWQDKVRRDAMAPKLIHYAGYEAKPWNLPNASFSEFYWFFLRRTFWYDLVHGKVSTLHHFLDFEGTGTVYKAAENFWKKLPPSVKKNFLIPANTIKKYLKKVQI